MTRPQTATTESLLCSFPPSVTHADNMACRLSGLKWKHLVARNNDQEEDKNPADTSSFSLDALRWFVEQILEKFMWFPASEENWSSEH